MTTTTHRTTAGHVLSSPDWLDVHFEAARPEYEAMFRFGGIESGSTVLDAGCGNGSYLSLIRETVGPHGSVYAIDFDPENARRAARRGNVAAAAASLTSLPFADGTFDAVWCANVVQFLDDDALLAALRDTRRILRPNGRLALKDVDMTALRVYPAPPLLGAHLAEACIGGEDVSTESRGSLRARELRRWLERAGFVEVVQRSFPIEYWAPLSPAATQLWSEWLPYLAGLAEVRGVPDEDLEVWRQVATPERARGFVSSPDFYACELQVVATGIAPDEDSK